MDDGQSYFAWTDETFDPANIFKKPEALRGVRIVEMCTQIGRAHV